MPDAAEPDAAGARHRLAALSGTTSPASGLSGDSHLEIDSKHWINRVPALHRDRVPRVIKLPYGGDAWIAEYADGKFAIYLGNYCVTTVEAGALDVPSLNSLFDMMRHRRPRRRNDK